MLLQGCAIHDYVREPDSVQSMTLHPWPFCDRYVTLTGEEQSEIIGLLSHAKFRGFECPPGMYVLEIQYQDETTSYPRFFLAESGEYMGYGLSRVNRAKIAAVILRVAARLEKDGHPPPTK
jgi:hypothetical protein